MLLCNYIKEKFIQYKKIYYKVSLYPPFVLKILSAICWIICPGNDQIARRRKITKIIRIRPIIKCHLKFRHKTYRNVFHGDVNHRNDVFGRLEKEAILLFDWKN